MSRILDVVGKNPTTTIVSPVVDDDITRDHEGGIRGLDLPCISVVLSQKYQPFSKNNAWILKYIVQGTKKWH